MNIFTHKGDGIIIPDFHVATTEGKEPVVMLSIVEPKPGYTSPAKVWLAPSQAIAMAEAILEHFNKA